MNALDELKNKMATNGYMTNIEMAIYNTTERFPITALHAAEELAQKDEQIRIGTFTREKIYAEALRYVAIFLRKAHADGYRGQYITLAEQLEKDAIESEQKAAALNGDAK